MLRNDSACGLLVAAALLLGLVAGPQRSSAGDLTPARIKESTSAVDTAMIKAIISGSELGSANVIKSSI